MEKILFYVMEGEKMCFNHAMLNAEALLDSGKEVKIILEGKSVKLPKVLEDEKNPLYKNSWRQVLLWVYARLVPRS